QFRQNLARSGFASPQLGHAAIRGVYARGFGQPGNVGRPVVRSRPMTRQSTRWRPIASLLLLSVVLAGCLAGPSEPASPALPSVSSVPTPTPTTEPTPTPSATPEPAPDQAKVPVFQAGAMAATRTTVRLRDLPGTQWGVAALLPSGAVVQVVLGPIRTGRFW